MNILITGGAGFLGTHIVTRLLADSTVERLVVFSRSEERQRRLRLRLGPDPRLRFFLGDVRAQERLERAMYRCDTVIHAAALKQVEAASYDPDEAFEVNVWGTRNVIHAAVRTGVSRVMVVSSDKACEASGLLYGVTKLAAEQWALHANAWTHPHGTRVSAIRYGNVMASTGSVVHVFRQQADAGGPLTLTDPRCTRFWLTADQAVAYVLEALRLMRGGDLFVPAALPAVRVGDLAEAVAPGVPTTVIGLRTRGEKLAEVLLSADETRWAVRVGRFYVVEPAWRNPTHGRTPWAGEALPEGFRYASDTAEKLDAATLREWLGEARE